MDTFQNMYMVFPGITPAEATFLHQNMETLSDSQKERFLAAYSVKRKDPHNILLLTVVGTLGIAGLQRFATGQIILGFLYLFTCGFFWIGTILDLINYKNIAAGYNHKMAYESYQIAMISGN